MRTVSNSFGTKIARICFVDILNRMQDYRGRIDVVLTIRCLIVLRCRDEIQSSQWKNHSRIAPEYIHQQLQIRRNLD
ncbi:hypothetical protein J6590_028297 [Homalodisca vitripennis]|nr:hypothetical protein J6590_028297 [Homalodisca vitripennis]